MKTTLEMFKEIEDLEVAPDNEGEPLKSVKDIVPNWCNKIEQALQHLEAIDNANPSEALECLKHIKKYYIPEPCSAKTYDCLETIKQALIKAEKEHNSTNLLMQELDCKDFAELRKYARCGHEKINKKYLKWEDLEFTKDLKCQKVKMNDNDYRIRYTLDDFGGKCCFLYDSARNHYIVLNKQFFNDLHLERVKE